MDSKYKYLLCRLCLCKNNGLCDIFKDNGKQGFNAADVITDLLLFQVSRTDGYPQFVCLKCNDRLVEFKNFKEECQKSKLKFENEHLTHTAGVSIQPFTKTNAEARPVVVVKTPRFSSSKSETDNKNSVTLNDTDINNEEKNTKKFHNIVLKKQVDECGLEKKGTQEKAQVMEAKVSPSAAQENEDETDEDDSISENSSVSPEVISSIPFRVNTWDHRKKVLECIECERRFWNMKKFNLHMKMHRGISHRYSLQKEQEKEKMIKESQRNEELIENKLKLKPWIASPLTTGDWKWTKTYECIECHKKFDDMERFKEHTRCHRIEDSAPPELDSKKEHAKEKDKKLEEGKIISFVAQRKDGLAKSNTTRENSSATLKQILPNRFSVNTVEFTKKEKDKKLEEGKIISLVAQRNDGPAKSNTTRENSSATLKQILPNPFSVNTVEFTKKVLECQREIFDITELNLQKEPGEEKSLQHEFNSQKETNHENKKKLEGQTLPCVLQKREEKIIASNSAMENSLVVAKKNLGQIMTCVIRKKEEKVIASNSATENSLVIAKKNLSQIMPCVIKKKEDKVIISNSITQNSSSMPKQIPSIPFSPNEADGRNKIFECTVCHKRFLDLKDCAMHMKMHRGMKGLLCYFDSQQEPTKENEKLHKGQINPQKDEEKGIPKQIPSIPLSPNTGDYKSNVPECIKCRMKFLDVKDFDAHMNRHKEEKSLSSQKEPAKENQKTQESRIDICEAQFHHEEVLYDSVAKDSPVIHIQAPSGLFQLTACESKKKEVFQCSQCPEKFSQEQNFKEHVKTHQEPKGHQCEFCGMGFKWNFMLKEHQRIHNGEKPFKCQFCCKCFTQKSSLGKHISKLHLETRFNCEWCTRKFSSKESLNNHLKLHRQFRPFGCDRCERRFLNAEAAEKHKLFHMGKSLFKCDICSSTFEHKLRLARHMRKSHGEEKPYGCLLCDKKFFQRYQLKSHLVLHSGVRAFTCEECGKAFRSRGNLTMHLRVHTGVKPYECNICSKRFTQIGSLRTHSKSHYNPPQTSRGVEKKTRLPRVIDMEGEFFAYNLTG